MKLVAEVSSSISSSLLPASRASAILAACEVLPLASKVEKVGGVSAAGQVVDEEGNVCVRYLAAILRPDFHGAAVGDDVLPAIPGNVVVDTPLQGFQQGGLAVISPAGNQRDSPADTHTPDRPPMGKL